jgi:adenylate cyclase
MRRAPTAGAVPTPGDPVNVSARMQQHAVGGELLVASGVADELMVMTLRRRLNLRGHDQPIDAFVLGT